MRVVIVIAAIAALTGCGRRPAQEERAVSNPPSNQDATARGDCAASLRALAAGDLAGFRGLPPCSRAEAAAALGPSRYDQDSTGPGGPFRDYPTSPAAPHGLVVFYDSTADRARYARIDEAIVPAGLDALGEPEAKAASGLTGAADQLVWASRGLTLHIRRIDGTVRRLYAYAPMTADEFLASDLAKAEVRREPRR